MTRQINAAGLALIKQFEGCKLEAYADCKGIWTIGTGHTMGVRKGDVISSHRADALLEADLAEAGDAVSRLVKVPLNDNQFAALVAFTFNVGEGAFARSTMLKKLNEDGYEMVPTYLKCWIFAGGKQVEGLVKRRAAEAELWSET